LSPARAPRGSHARPEMAEDNSARLQAMQDAVTDAGNDVRALKVRARSRIFSLSSPAYADRDCTERRIPDRPGGALGSVPPTDPARSVLRLFTG